MKKLIAAALTASMLVSGASAMAANRVSDMANGNNPSQIQILYNSGYLQSGDVAPINTEGRVMIPFRSALEGMGAKVEYTDATRLVTATKDDITIQFTLLDDTIHIDNNGAKSTLKMDVPMIIKNDRTLVPIRFMSSAFGMQVGWDGDNQTVLILDGKAMGEECENSMPNLKKLVELNNTKYNDEHTGIKFNFAIGGASKVDVSADADIDYKGDASASNVSMTVKSFSLNGGGETVKVNNSKADCIVADGKIYIKTDIIEKAAKNANSSALNAAAQLVKGGEWYSIDLESVLTELLGADMAEMYLNLFNMTERKDVDFAEMFTRSVPENADVTRDNMYTVAMFLDTYEEVDKRITVTEKGDGEYSVTIKFTSEDLFGIIKPMLEVSGLADADVNAMMNAITFNVEAKSDVTTSGTKSTAKFNMGINLEGTEIKADFDMTDEAKVSDNVSVPEIPSAANDITNTIKGLLK